MSNFNNVSIFKLPSVSGFGGNEDGISGLIVLSPIAAGSTLVNEQVYKLRSIRDAEQAGLTDSGDGSEQMDLAYKHVAEFFRFNPTGTLYFLLSTAALTFSAALATTAGSLAKKLLAEANGEVRQLGIARVTDLGTQTAGAGVAQEVLDAIAPAQALVDNEFDPNKRPLDIVLEGHGWAGTVAAASDLRDNYDAKHVAVVIAQDPAISALNAAFEKHAAVGTFLGISARGQVHESIGWVQQSNLLDASQSIFLNANLSNNSAASDYEADFDLLWNKGYTFAQRIAGQEGTYFIDAPTCTPRANMVSFWRHARTLHKASRAVRAALLPEVNRPVEVDPDTGLLAPRFVSLFEGIARGALDLMIGAEELSGFQVYVNPEQNISATGTVEVNYEITPFGAANAIQASIALVPSLSS